MRERERLDHANKLDDEMDRVWDILMSSKSPKTRTRCLKILEHLQHVQDCYLSGDGI